MACYEITPNTLKMLPTVNGSRKIPISRFDIFDADVDDPAFILHNVLSPEECRQFINQAESMGMTPTGSQNSIRFADRVSARSESVAKVLFDRVRPFLKDSVVIENEHWPHSGICPKGIPHNFPSGEWVPHGLNEVFRICRYQPGGHFKPHHDGGFRRSNDEQSIQTFMLYLNGGDDFEGGATNFYQENQLHYKDGDPDKITYSFRPSPGDVLIFNSRITHDGGKVVKGKKYIMRSEVMYRKVQHQTS